MKLPMRIGTEDESLNSTFKTIRYNIHKNNIGG